ncbi:uncharacterized protein LOC115314722 isoform X3 [Ixodes scapularis]|uniref:uncharacterized protein LOC115314722 isoform X3 n=1 Tax=Ixodes scapularis TaxID=6945 RepID=UPI001A9FFE0F|nr:uncharacterized protein LOC115314722 isoform X3 [Ixodes scapularis]
MDTKAVRRLHWRRCALKTVKPPKERACQMKLLQMTPLQMYHWPSCSDDDGNTFIFPKLGALHDTIISGKPLTSSSFRKIVELLFRAMVNITVWMGTRGNEKEVKACCPPPSVVTIRGSAQHGLPCLSMVESAYRSVCTTTGTLKHVEAKMNGSAALWRLSSSFGVFAAWNQSRELTMTS